MNRGIPSLDRRWALGLAALFLLVFALYLRTLSPAFHPDDSGETIACAATLSIQHPPGYPLDTLLGRLAVFLGPGPACFNVNLLSALLGSLCAVEAACLIFVLGLEWAPEASRRGVLAAFAWACGLLLALPREVWFQAGIAKGGIYTLNLALTLGTLLALLRVRDACLRCPIGRLRGGVLDCGCPAPGALGLAALLFGLGLADHWPSQVVLLPAYALLLAEPRFKRRAWPRPGAWPGLALRVLPPLACGLALYGVLPMRERLGAPLVWGDLTTWKGLADLVLRRQYAGVESGRTLGSILALLGHVGGDAAQAWTWLGLAFLGLGWVRLFRRRPWLAGGLFAIPLGLVLGVALGSKPPPDSLFIVDPYLLPLHVGLGLGLAGFFPASPAPARPWPVFWVLLGALVLGAWQWPFCDHSDDYLGWDYAHNLLLSAPPHAVLLSQGDANVACPLVPLLVQGRRPDLTPLVAVLCDDPWYRASVSRRDPSLKWPPFFAGPKRDFAWMARANAPRPLVWTGTPPEAWAGPQALLPRGLVQLSAEGRPASTTARSEEADLWPAFVLRGLFDPWASRDPLSRRLILGAVLQSQALLAQDEAQAGNLDAALRAYQRLAALGPGNALAWLQAGELVFKSGDWAQARVLWRRAETADPSDATAWADEGLADLKLGQSGQAFALARKALALDPGSRDARLLLQWAGGLARPLASGSPSAPRPSLRRGRP